MPWLNLLQGSGARAKKCLGLVSFREDRCKLSCLGSAGNLRAIPLVTANSFSSHSFYWGHYCVAGLQKNLYFSFLLSGSITSFSDAILKMLFDCILWFLIHVVFARILMERRHASKNTWKHISIHCSHCSILLYHLCLASLLQYHFFYHWSSCNLNLLIVFLYPNMLKEGRLKTQKKLLKWRWMRMSTLYVQHLKWKQIEISFGMLSACLCISNSVLGHLMTYFEKWEYLSVCKSLWLDIWDYSCLLVCKYDLYYVAKDLKSPP